MSSSTAQMSDNKMIAMYETLLNNTRQALKNETDIDKMKTLNEALAKLMEAKELLIEIEIQKERKIIKESKRLGGSKTKKGGNKKRRKTRNNRK